MEVNKVTLVLFAVASSVFLGACTKEAIKGYPKVVGERVLLQENFVCHETGLQTVDRPKETHRCFFASEGGGAKKFSTAEKRAEFVMRKYSPVCGGVRVIADEPADGAVYETENMPRLHRVSVACQE